VSYGSRIRGTVDTTVSTGLLDRGLPVTAVVSNVSSDTRIGIIVLRLRIEHAYRRMRTQRRAFRNIERHVLSRYQATLLPSGEHQVQILYRTEHDLDERMDDLLFEIAGEAQMSGCYSETEARMEGSDRQW
jgi:hypothetical protein